MPETFYKCVECGKHYSTDNLFSKHILQTGHKQLAVKHGEQVNA